MLETYREWVNSLAQPEETVFSGKELDSFCKEFGFTHEIHEQQYTSGLVHRLWLIPTSGKGPALECWGTALMLYWQQFEKEDGIHLIPRLRASERQEIYRKSWVTKCFGLSGKEVWTSTKLEKGGLGEKEILQRLGYQTQVVPYPHEVVQLLVPDFVLVTDDEGHESAYTPYMFKHQAEAALAEYIAAAQAKLATLSQK